MIARDFSDRDIHLALDGELPEDERALYQSWLDANPDMNARATRYSDDLALIRGAVSGLAEEPVPARLAAIVTGEGKRVQPAARSAWWRQAAAAALIFVVGGAAGYFGAVGSAGDAAGPADRLADSAIGAYVTFAVDQPRPVEVKGVDKTYLESWLSKRTGLKLVAPDLSAQGFELLGGRILPAGRHVAALLVYADHAGNQVSIYLSAEGKAKTKGVYTPVGGGPSAVYWLDEGFGCAIVSAAPKEVLDAVAGNAWRQIKEGLAS
ncbi:anti-sigma factor [Mesorhizobium sp. LHD-90]|uniref:anti-sigma factor family protein n=1 Tax=Mesorhizobium sp. LHD-90 TaxID=3071414 RepID=UPI0027DF6D4A|nr:anti-sigma factor [Mesorhizobium sp. LHD-90]MDQ6438000.1 anti-sigma factor [Mesorhizobium sp. LHD-90]